MPDAKIKNKDVFVGALVTTVLLLIGQWGISLYIGFANIETVYGAAAFMAIFITWIYYSAIIIYTGAEFTKAWANKLGGKIFPDEYAVATKVIEIRRRKQTHYLTPSTSFSSIYYLSETGEANKQLIF